MDWYWSMMFWGVYAGCGLLAYGITFADFQKGFPSIACERQRKDMALSFFVAMGGPIGLAVIFFMSGFAEHGLMYRRKK